MTHSLDHGISLRLQRKIETTASHHSWHPFLLMTWPLPPSWTSSLPFPHYPAPILVRISAPSLGISKSTTDFLTWITLTPPEVFNSDNSSRRLPWHRPLHKTLSLIYSFQRDLSSSSLAKLSARCQGHQSELSSSHYPLGTHYLPSRDSLPKFLLFKILSGASSISIFALLEMQAPSQTCQVKPAFGQKPWVIHVTIKFEKPWSRWHGNREV